MSRFLKTNLSARTALTRLLALLLLLVVMGSAFAETYEYDDAGRLIKVSYDNGSSTTYTYDNNGNRLTVNSVAANQAPTTSSDDLTVAANATGTVQISVTDADPGDTHSFAVTTQGTLGTASVDATGLVTYVAANAAGNDTVEITVTDAGGLTATLTIAVTITAPEAVDSNDDGLSDSRAAELGLDPNITNADTDGDGITDVDEVGDPDNPADTDGDGVIDALEVGDAATDPLSLQFQVPAPTADALQLPDLSGQEITLTATGASALTATGNEDTGLPVMSEEEMALSDPDFDYPFGLYGFTLTVTVGETATVVIQLPAAAVLPANTVYRKVDAAGTYSTFDGAEIDATANTITLTLTDGGAGDEDGSANGLIVEPGGIALPASTQGLFDSDDGGGFCFIATAAYGSYQAPHVQTLRNFRDRFLLTHAAGRWWVRQYYAHSPPAAAWLTRHDDWRAVVRVALLPLIGVAWFMTEVAAVVQVGTIVLLLGMLIWMRRRRRQVPQQHMPHLTASSRIVRINMLRKADSYHLMTERITNKTMPQTVRMRICKRVCSVAALIFGFLFLAVSVTHAHTISPLELTMSSTATFSVKDQATCSATITVLSNNTGIATVTPGEAFGVEVTFTVQAVAPGKTTIAIGWVGEDFPDPTGCNENTNGLTQSISVEVIADGSTAGCSLCGDVAEPVNTFSGELYEPVSPDINLGGPMPLVFQRYYAAFLRRSFIVGDLGSNWRHSFDARLFISGNTATYISHKGRVTDFLKNLITGNWEQQTNLDTPYQLVTPASQDAILFDPVDDRIFTFDLTIGGVNIGKLVTVEDGHGNVHSVTYDLTNGQIETVSDGLGRTLTFTYNTDAIPKIVIVTDGTRPVNFQYTDTIDSEVLTLFTDARGGTTTYAYKDTSANADHALMLRKTLPRLNAPFIQTYDALGRVETQTDANGNTFSFSYDGADTTITDPLGNTRVHTHTSTGEFSNRTDQAGFSFSLASDANGRRNSITDRLGDTTSLTYHEPSGDLSSVTNADGTTTSFSYIARILGNGLTLFDLTEVVFPDGTTQTMMYDANGNLTAFTDQAGNLSTFTYNDRGQPLTATSPAGGLATNTYNADGTRASRTDPSSHTTTFAYDSLKRLITMTHADGTPAIIHL